MEKLVTRLAHTFKGKKVLITGHTGFKGAWLMALLHEFGANIKGYALAPAYEKGLFNLLEPLQIAESVIGDIRDKDKLEQTITVFQPDFIFHLAAQPLVRRSYAIPAETFDVNVTGTANLLELVTKLSIPCVTVIITTDKVYQNKEQDILYKEDDTLGGYDPYSASKACTELVVSSFRSSFFNIADFATHKKALAPARAGNVIGGGDWSTDRIIPDIVRSLSAGEVISIRNPGAVRPWQHVLEPLTGYLLLAAALAKDPQTYSRPYNFGPQPADHLPVRALADFAIATWGSGSWKHTSSTDDPHEAGLLKLAIDRAVNELKWQPRLSAREAIEWTINWYRQPMAEQAAYTFQQIKQYLRA